jgi:hypothetical protein
MSSQALREARAEREAKIKAQVEAAKIPAVRLSEAQIASLRENAPNDQILWYGAGRQSDGTIFVCLVTGGKNPIGGGTHTQLFTGTFEADATFHQTLAYLVNHQAVINDCRRRGFDPPVRIVHGF